MKLPGRPVLYPLMIAVGLPLGILGLFGIERWDQVGFEYRDRARYHSGIVSWARARRKNLEKVVSGRLRIEDRLGASLDRFGLKEDERTDLHYLHSKIKKFAAAEAYSQAMAAKYDRAWRFFWFLPTSPDPTPPEAP